MKVTILLTSLLFIFCLKAYDSSAQNVNKQDSLALVYLYNSTNGPGWISNTNWLTSAPVSSWFGITVDSGRVRWIMLGYNKLVGMIPSSLGNLSKLETLILTSNQLSGSIPSSLGDLPLNPSINLNFNQLSGNIPASFKDLPTSAALHVEYNKFNFTSFEDLYLVPFLFNKNQANIPLTKNGNLLSVSAGGTLSNNTYKWYKDTTLVSTKRGDSTFTISSTGNYSVAVTNALVTQLTLYSISTTSHQDSLALVELYNSTKGAEWENNNNWLTTAPVSTWSGVTERFGRVTELLLDSNNLAGILPTSIGNLSNLKNLSLNCDNITGNIPSSIGNLLALENLSLFSNMISGNIPFSLGNLTNLEHINFSDNQLNGNIPSSIGSLSSLTDINLYKNKLSGIIPPEISNISNLRQLVAGENMLTGSVPSSICKLSEIKGIYLNNNQLTGNIPDSISYLSNLFDLELQNNQLSGNIPDSIGKLSRLSYFNVNNNKLSGPIPFSMLKLNAFYFDLASNYFTFAGMDNLPKSNFFVVYAPQADIPLSKNGNILSVSAGGTLANDTFKLYKDGSLVATHVGDSTFALPGDGKISVSVTNSIATQLTLYSDTISVGLALANANTTVTEDITGYNSIDVNNGIVELLKLAPTQGPNSITGKVTSAVTFDTTVSTYKNQPYVQRHFDITPSTNADKAQATVTLYFTQQDFDNYNSYLITHSLANPTLPVNGVDNGNVRIIQFHGTFTGSSNPANYSDSASVVIIPAVTWNAEKNWWAVTFPVSGFSGFYVSTGGFTLPLTLLQFSATPEKIAVYLQWLTTNEINTKQFIIERGNSNLSFKSIGNVAARSTPGNNNYTFYDEEPLNGNNFYRLKMIDKDGKFIYGPTVIVKRTGAAIALSVYPNPSNSNITLLFNQTASEDYFIDIKDMSGRLLKQVNGLSVAGLNKVNIDTHLYAKGTYLITLANKETGKQTIKFSRQ